jgi:predicted dehydrogenase
MKNYRVAVIGRTGKGNYGHGLDMVWKEFPNVEIVAVADENEAGGKAAAARLGAKAIYTDYRKMLAAEKPQIVSVAPRWLDAHHDMVIACAEAHASIFLEKPMCRTAAEADAMLGACERAHVKMAIAHQMRLSPIILDIRERLRRGEIGQLLEMRSRGKEDARAGGEDLMVLGTHVFDLMRFFAGDPLWCFAHVTTAGRELNPADVRDGAEGIGPLAGDSIAALYAFPNRVHASVGTQANDDRSGLRWGLDLFVSQGILTIRAGMEPFVWILRSNTWAPDFGPKKAVWEKVSAPEGSGGGQIAGNVRLVRDLIEAIEQDRQPLSSGYDGRWSLEMILAVYASQRAGTRIPLPLKDRRHPLAV